MEKILAIFIVYYELRIDKMKRRLFFVVFMLITQVYLLAQSSLDTVLYHSVRLSDYESVRTCIYYGADPEFRDLRNRSLLTWSVLNNDTALVRLFLNYPTLYSDSLEVRSLSDLMVRRNYLDVFKMFYKKDNFEKQALKTILEKENTNFLLFLLAENVSFDVNNIDKKLESRMFKTALASFSDYNFEASNVEFNEFAELLINQSSGSLANSFAKRNYHQLTDSLKLAFIYNAIECSDYELVQFFVSKGMDLFSENEMGLSPYKFAMLGASRDLKNFFEKIEKKILVKMKESVMIPSEKIELSDTEFLTLLLNKTNILGAVYKQKFVIRKLWFYDAIARSLEQGENNKEAILVEELRMRRRK